MYVMLMLHFGQLLEGLGHFLMDVNLFNWDHLNAKILSSKINSFGFMKLYGFHGNPLSDFKEWGVPSKILISQQHLILEY